MTKNAEICKSDVFFRRKSSFLAIFEVSRDQVFTGFEGFQTAPGTLQEPPAGYPSPSKLLSAHLTLL